MKSPIKITPSAACQIKALLDDAPKDNKSLLLNIKTTGCSGNSYSMEYIVVGEDISGYEKFEDEGASIYIPKLYSWMLFGMTVDYISDELGNSRFDFINPNETSRCGCGESFHVGGGLLKV